MFKKKIKVPKRFLRMAEPISESEEKKNINTIIEAMKKIFNFKKDNTPKSYDYKKIYGCVFDLVLKKKADVLYQSIKQCIEKHSNQFSIEVENTPDSGFLIKLLEIWKSYRSSIVMCKNLLQYLDEQYVKKMVHHATNPILNTQNMGIYYYKHSVLLKLKNKIQKLMIGEITKERKESQCLDTVYLKQLTSMMLEVDTEVYSKIFEKEFINNSHNFFNKEAQDFFYKSTAPEYLKKVEKRLIQEKKRSQKCLSPTTTPKILDVIKEEMIKKYKDLVVTKEGSGVDFMLKQKKKDDLKLLYRVLSIVKGALQPTIKALHTFCEEEGQKIVKDPKKDEEPTKLVQELIDLRVYYSELLKYSFSVKAPEGGKLEDKNFAQVIKDSFDSVVNQNQRFPEYLSLILDAKLNKGSKGMDSDDLDKFFDNAILVFRHVKSKDVFETYYKNHLAKRLLQKTSRSDEDETAFLNKLKIEFGKEFTNKLEGMFKDIKVSDDLNTNWKNFSKNKKEKCIDLSVKILTRVFWPVKKSSVEFTKSVDELFIHMGIENIKKYLNVFEKFYLDRHNGRKLEWEYRLGSADIKVNGFGKKYEINVSTIQMFILQIFNQKGKDGDDKNVEFTFQEIVDFFSSRDSDKNKIIPQQEIKRNLLSLGLPLDKKEKSNSKLLIIKNKDSNKNEKKIVFSNTTRFIANNNFKATKTKMKVKNFNKKQDKKKLDETNHSIYEERKWVVDSVIVRNMKNNKRLEHSKLINAVITQLQHKFFSTSLFVKKRIESLIERDYIERAEDQRWVYVYKA